MRTICHDARPGVLPVFHVRRLRSVICSYGILLDFSAEYILHPEPSQNHETLGSESSERVLHS